ncbi:MAG: hypothetical protein ABEJ68_11790 [Halobacteriaceae archaeon]
MRDVVVGLDGGGTHTRVAVAALDGRILGAAERGGASTEHNDPRAACANLRGGVRTAFDDAGRVPADVAALTGDPGVVALAGTGSIVLGRTADGEQVRNYDCGHYARTAARHVTQRALHAMLAGEVPADWPLGDRLLDRWGCDSLAALRSAVRDGARFSTTESGNALDSAAPLVTAAAADGDPTARALCDDAVDEMETGIRCVAGYLAPPVAITPVGSVLRSDYVRAELGRRFDGTDRRVVDPVLSPVAGAVYDGIERTAGADENTVERLADHEVSRP